MENREVGLKLSGCKPSLVLSVFSPRLTDIIDGTRTTAIAPHPESQTDVKGAAMIVGNGDDKNIDGLTNIRDAHISTPSATGLTCSTCKIKFETFNDQREHFKLDWHRFNVKLLLDGKNVLDEREFEDQISDVSSISGSDSDSDLGEDSRSSSPSTGSGGQFNDNREPVVPERPEFYNRVYYFDGVRSVYALHKCMAKGQHGEQAQSFASAVEGFQGNGCIIVAMMSGGHFAAVVFHADKMVEHKTFHRYTIRAKRGTTQSVHDHSKFARSAGASIRRHNEAALAEDIKNLFVGWSDHVHHAKLIFYKCPAHSKTVFFGNERPFGKGVRTTYSYVTSLFNAQCYNMNKWSSKFTKGDNRIRKIPFITRRPTLKEVQRVFSDLTSVHCFDFLPNHAQPYSMSHNSAEDHCVGGKKGVQESDVIVNERQKHMVLDATQVEDSQSVRRTGNDKTPVSNFVSKKTSGKTPHSVDETETRAVNPKSYEDSSLLSNADEKVDCSVSVKENKEKKNGKSGSYSDRVETSGNTANDTFPYAMYNRALGLCEKGDLDGLQILLDKSKCSSIDCSRHCSELGPDSTQNDVVVMTPLSCMSCQFRRFLNHHEENGRTLLHKAALCGHCDLVWLLMKNGADPSNRDDRGKTPYTVAESKDVRNTFRRFMAEFPFRYDYRAAQIPTPLTTAMEEERARKNNEKKKAQRKARKAREKVSKAAEVDGAIKVSVGSSANTLTDREKRATAAERRFGTQLTENSRCANCGCQVEAKTAFRRYDFMYCTTHCVHEHRQKIGK